MPLLSDPELARYREQMKPLLKCGLANETSSIVCLLDTIDHFKGQLRDICALAVAHLDVTRARNFEQIRAANALRHGVASVLIEVGV